MYNEGYLPWGHWLDIEGEFFVVGQYILNYCQQKEKGEVLVDKNTKSWQQDHK